jgi:HlyD family secretion protein
MTEKGAAISLRSIRRLVLLGVLAVGIVALGIGGLAATTELSGAVVGSGYLVVDTNVKKVQHPSGGIVGELLVRNGDRVRAASVLLRLDETLTRSNLAIVAKGLDELAARQARLEAERDGLGAVMFPEELRARAGNADVGRVIEGEQKLFELRRSAREGQRAQLRERIAQLQQEVIGLAAQEGAKMSEIGLIDTELSAVRTLWQKNLVPISRLTAVEREGTKLEGERGQLIAAVAKARGKISETELQIIQLDQDLRSEVGRELREIQAKSGELTERKVAAEDQLKRIDIRAPQDGTVHQLQVHTIGGVIAAGEQIMLIVPDTDTLTVEVRISPQDIDQLRVGQGAVVRFLAFNMGTTPELNGVVSQVSADLVHDQRTGVSYFLVRIALPEQEIARLGDVKLVPGMPLEAFVQTGARTVLSYLVKPLRDQAMRAFRER